jgi:2-oxoglutarate dehydrogenase E2 component (dihydrolipoamide succinyltransferase)
MAVDLKVPAVGESITEAFVNRWFKSEGDFVNKDETIAELETEKATFELPAPVAGRLTRIAAGKGSAVQVGQVIGQMEEGQAPAGSDPAAAAAPAPAAAAPAGDGASSKKAAPAQPRIMPAAAQAMAATGVKAEQVQPTGPGGRILKEDVTRAAAATAAPPATAASPAPVAAPAPVAPSAPSPAQAAAPSAHVEEEIVPMSPMRQTIARRLVEAQQTAALLTTFNEVDMSAVMALRKQHQDSFEKRYGIKLGFMSFFAKAAVDALKQFPAINAEIRGASIVYKNHYDIGIAVSTERGLIVPVIRNVDRLSFAEIEQKIADFAGRARAGKISVHELHGGTFTITNGGIFGSLLSTPIVNPPQSGVMGMHAIQDRPVARDGQVVIRPMMYLALTYDHRIVDGREAVTFLKRIKETVEDPARLLIEA